MARRLLLDAGNTRLKWAVAEGSAWLDQGALPYEALPELCRHVVPAMACVVASVAPAEHEQAIARLLAPLGIVPRWLAAAASSGDVRNAYLPPQSLGVDRWMALIAARRRTQQAALVVSVGTAMTVDALSAAGVFLGGVIVPGMGLMQQALREGTARVAPESGGVWQAFPRCTADAVASGVVAALCGAIERQHARLAELAGERPACLLTGGDAASLLPHLAVSAELAPQLVLEGIDWSSREDGAE